MEIHSYSSCDDLLAQGKTARVQAFPCGHIVLSIANLRLRFTREDFRDFVHTIMLAETHRAQRETELTEWGLFM
ncbi:MAG: hypothetical protein JSR44_02390 [Spirochaetes bacterium]|nr:hypothetical protein [Spirochaetota bacterium]